MLKGKRKFILLAFVILIAGFLVSGVFAATSIRINSGNNVQLGAGTTFATSCDDQVTVKFDSSFSAALLTDTATPLLHSIVIRDIDPSACSGQKLSAALVDDNKNVKVIASWYIHPTPQVYEVEYETYNGQTNPDYTYALCGRVSSAHGTVFPECGAVIGSTYINQMPIDIVHDMPSGGHISVTIEPFQ
jgi:hypothetical protein